MICRFRQRMKCKVCLIVLLIGTVLVAASSYKHNLLVPQTVLHNITNNETYSRIAVFPLFAEEILFELVPPTSIVYVGHSKIEEYDHYYPNLCFAHDIPGSIWQNCNEDFLFSLKPDLIILPQDIEGKINDVFPNLSKKSIKTLYLPEPKTIKDIERTINDLGVLLGETGKAKEVITEMKNGIKNSIRTLNSSKSTTKKIVYYENWQESFSIIADICQFRDFAENQDYLCISSSKLACWNPDIIFYSPLLTDTDGSVLSADSQYNIDKMNIILNDPDLSMTNAVQKKCVFPLVLHSSHLIYKDINFVINCISCL